MNIDVSNKDMISEVVVLEAVDLDVQQVEQNLALEGGGGGGGGW